MTTIDDEVLSTFLSESEDRLMDIESGILAMENYGEETDPELIHSIFRDAHSIKAGANLLGLRNIERLSHGLENVLDRIRGGGLIPDNQVATLLLEAVDSINELFEDVTSSDEQDVEDLHGDLCATAQNWTE